MFLISIHVTSTVAINQLDQFVYPLIPPAEDAASFQIHTLVGHFAHQAPRQPTQKDVSITPKCFPLSKNWKVKPCYSLITIQTNRAASWMSIERDRVKPRQAKRSIECIIDAKGNRNEQRSP